MAERSVHELAESSDWRERIAAARIVAHADDRDADVIAARLLRDAANTDVPQAMVDALLEARGEAAIPLLLQALDVEP